MASNTGAQAAVVMAGDWQAEVLRSLETGHLAVWSPDAAARVRFGAGLAHFLLGMPGVELCVLHGRAIGSLDGFCEQVERSLSGPALDRRIGGARGLVAFLRARPALGRRAPSKFRFYVWHDADTLIGADRAAFSRIVEAIAGVAAEWEFVIDDTLLLQRLVLVGGPALAAYAQDPAGACRAWPEGGPSGGMWRLITGLDAPRFALLPVEA